MTNIVFERFVFTGLGANLYPTDYSVTLGST